MSGFPTVGSNPTLSATLFFRNPVPLLRRKRIIALRGDFAPLLLPDCIISLPLLERREGDQGGKVDKVQLPVVRLYARIALL